MNVVVMAVGFIIAAAGVAGLAAPSLPIEAGRAVSAAPAIYFVAAARIAVGALMLWIAPRARWPLVVRILGAIMLVVGILTPVFGVDRSRAVVEWLASQDTGFVRMIMLLPIALGSLIAYAAAPRARS